MQQTNWFVAQNGQSQGPFTLEQIKQMIADNQLTPATLVWHEGFVGWEKAAESELAGLFNETEPEEASQAQTQQTYQNNDEQWYLILKTGKRMGPLSRDDAILYIEGPETMVWHSGLAQWQPAGQSELAPYITIMESAYGPVNNNIVWVAAFAPLLGILLSKLMLHYMAGPEEIALLQQGIFPDSFMWIIFVPLILQTALGILDLFKLNQAGYKVINLAIAMVLVFPLYLFLRARTVNTGYNYLVAYLICTGVVMFT